VERPVVAEAVHHTRVGEPIGVGVSNENQRWLLLTSIVDATDHQLNARQDVPALILAPPHKVRSGQRRQFFRVATVGINQQSAILMPSHADEITDDSAGACRVGLVNISGGGFWVAVASSETEPFQMGEACVCRLTLPHLTFPMDVPVRIRRVSPLDGGRTYLGLQFDFDDNDGPASTRIIDEVCRFATQVQREQIRLLRQKQ